MTTDAEIQTALPALASGNAAVITGGASGIGLGIARAAGAEGMKVMLADIEGDVLERAGEALRAAGVDAHTVVCDVSERDSVVAAATATRDRFGKAHLVCNNAGVSTGGFIDECDPGDWDWSVGVNLMGVVHGCEAFVPLLKRQGEGGHIVNTASMAGVLGAMAGWAPYNATKFAVVGLTEALRQEGRAGGFGVSVLCPGGVNTRIFEAPRNRQARFGPQVSRVAILDDPDEIKQGLDPDVVGRLVIEAVRANRLYIFTDPRFRKLVERRFQRLLEDFEWAANCTALNEAAAPGSARSVSRPPSSDR
jgi:NAD(P)-dependent dehydrogenase (short-subunit alcohol dehydrogenase family)